MKTGRGYAIWAKRKNHVGRSFVDPIDAGFVRTEILRSD